MTVRTTWRRLWMGLTTVTGIRQAGYFIPYRYAATSAGGPTPNYEALSPRFEAAEESITSLIQIINSYSEQIDNIGKNEPPEPRWRQDWFPRLDGAAAYSFVRHFRPRRIIEIGSGHSTRFIAKGIRDENLECLHTAIDPAPRADISALETVETIRKTVGEIDLKLFNRLEPGDFLIIDSSHILMPGTDVDVLLNHVLPSLPAGVIVHFHDILLPDGYPQAWDWRGYNEQQGIAALLQGGAYEIMG
ncbi:MAG: class I SAM-dependent methyltransferase [Proteobacteria bacterium]|nr:class I SAM-dependent methyltransferase [Pseudomonadota bacterium]